MGIIVFALLVALFLFMFYLIGKGVEKFVLVLPVAAVVVWFSTILPGLLIVLGNLLLIYIGYKLFIWGYKIKNKSIGTLLYIGLCLTYIIIPNLIPVVLFIIMLSPLYRIISFILSLIFKKKKKDIKTYNNLSIKNNQENEINNINIGNNGIIDVDYINI